MSRIDIDRQDRLEPQRIQKAKEELLKKNVEIVSVTDKEITFTHKGSLIKFFPYSGWHSGKTIKDGRGLKNLLEQL